MHTSGEVIKFDEALKPAAAPNAAANAAPVAKRMTGCRDWNFVTFSRHPSWNPRVQHVCEQITRDNGENLLHVAIGTMSKAMFIFLPLIAFLNMLMYWRPRYRYAEQLLFFVHLHALYFSAAIIMVSAIEAASSWPKLEGLAGVLETALGWLLPVYTVVAMRRVFHRSWMGTLFKGAVLFSST